MPISLNEIQLFTNNAVTLLAAPIGPADTSMTVMTGFGALFPSPGPGQFFLVTLENQAATLREIIKVTGRTGDTFTGLVRAQEGTTAQSWSASLGSDTLVDHRITAETMDRAMLLPHVLNNLDDVDTLTTPPVAGQVLKFDGTNWVPGTDNNAGGSGTVTSVHMVVPPTMQVTGTPITTAGTFTITHVTQSANTFFVGPVSGGPAVPTFRTVGINELNDVDTLTVPPTNGQVLSWNGTNWAPITTSTTLDDDLIALASFAGIGIPARTATDTWELRAIDGTAGRIIVTNGLGTVGNPTIDLATAGTAGTYTQVTTDAFGRVVTGANPTTLAGYGITDAQPLDNELSAIAALAGTGMLALTGAGTAATRTIMGTAGNIVVGNGDGVIGNPVINLATVGAAGTWGNSTNIPVFTTDIYGRVTAVTNTAVNFPVTSVFGRTGAVVAAEGDYNITQLGDVSISAPAVGQQLHWDGGNWVNFTPPDYLTDPGANGIVVRTGLGVTIARITSGGTGISVANGDGLAGNITITNTGVTSLAGTAGEINVSAATGAVTLSVGTELAGLADLSTDGVLVRTGPGTYTTRTVNFYSENFAGGGPAVATGNDSVALGSLSDAQAVRSLAIGEHSVARVPGGINMAAGRIQTSGDAQTGTYIMKAVTTNALSKELFIDGPSGTQRAVLQDDSTWMFTIHLTAHRTDATGGHAGWFIKGVVYRGAGAATTAMQGVAHKEIIARSNAAWDVNIGVNTVDGGLQVLVTGEAGKTIRWLARVETAELTN